MPRGRVKPVHFSESFKIQQEKAKVENEYLVAELARQKVAEAQDQLRREELFMSQKRAAHERMMSENKKRDDDLMHMHLESKIAELNVVDEQRLQDDAENDLHASQMAALLAEKSANPMSELDNDALVAEMAALQVKIQNVLDTDVATATA